MADAFDPYYVWLGIPPEEQPADYYRLLGLRRFEASPAVIDNAADRAMGHLRSVATGKHAGHAQRLLNELAAARVCLLSPEARAKYDAELKAKLVATTATGAPGGARMRFTPPPVPGPPSPARPIPQPQTPAAAAATVPVSTSTVAAVPSVAPVVYRRRSGPAWVAPLVTFVSVVAVGMIGYSIWQNRDEQAKRVAGGASTEGDGKRGHDEKSREPNADSSTVDSDEARTNAGNGSADSQVDAPPPVGAAKSPPVVQKPVEEKDDVPESALDKPGDSPPDSPPETPPEDPPASPPPEQTPPNDFASIAKREPVPAAADIAARKEQIRDLFRAELARTKPAELVATAKMLLDHARNTKDDLVGKYALLDSAWQLAVDNGEVNVAKDAVLDIIAYYDVDALELKAESLLELGRSPLVPEMKRVYFQGAWPVVRELMEGERYEFVPRLTALLLPIAHTFRDRQLVQDIKDAERDARELREAYEPLLPLVERLAKMPDDAEASGAVGKFRCYHAGNWPRGLPLLAKGNDAPLAKLAAADLANPTDAKVQMELGDAWRDAAKTAGGKRQELEVNERAAHWYERARANLSGLDAAKVAQSLKDLPRKPRHHVDALKFGTHWYKLFPTKVGWKEAKRRCEAIGGYLVCIETKEEAAFVYRLARPAISDNAWCWVGATDEEREGDFRWINGSPFVAAQWWSGQPDNNGGTEHYLTLAAKGYNDANDAHASVFVCEWEN